MDRYDTLQNLINTVLFQRNEKFHFYFDSCCLDLFKLETNVSDLSLENTTCIEDSDILVIGRKIFLEEIDYLNSLENIKDKKIIAFGNCTISAGKFSENTNLESLDDYIKVDYYVYGCPPTFYDFRRGVIDLLQLRE